MALHIAATTDLSPASLDRLRRFLETAFEEDFGAGDWRSSLGGRHAWLEDDEGIVAHASVVPRVLVCAGRALLAGYVEAVATRHDSRHRGLGSEIMRAVADVVGGSYEIGALSSNADAFYERLGWERWVGPTGVARDLSMMGGAWDRTKEDDGGVWILRTPRTPPLDVAGSIVCEPRDGEVW